LDKELNDSSVSADYDLYVRDEWERFVKDPARAQALLDAVAGTTISRVLDVGCGAGQELLPFVAARQAFGVGLDYSPHAGREGRRLYRAHQPSASVAFLRGAAEALPFKTGSFDVVICRLALPYTDNARALAEMARVLRAGGTLLLKFHHARYYVKKLSDGLFAGDVLSMVHSVRVLLAGAFYHVAGRQSHSRLTAGGETFQTEWLLKRELSRQRLTIRCRLPDSNPLTPSLVITKD
jgi:ubiquinone/menaquinone biosynthesis C-methylase UbiE